MKSESGCQIIDGLLAGGLVRVDGVAHLVLAVARLDPVVRLVGLIARDAAALAEFYRDVLGMELLHGGEDAGFSSLRASDAESAILNLEQGHIVPRWGRLIFHVSDVDAFWTHLKERGFHPEIPRDASWGERYFHMLDPDGHELSFARPLP